MPRRLENDRWLFGATLALCLIGAVMIFSASAVTAEHQYGHSYIFLLRQAAWLIAGLLGMFALMRMDYRRLREPVVVYTALCVVLLLLVGAFFLDLGRPDSFGNSGRGLKSKEVPSRARSSVG